VEVLGEAETVEAVEAVLAVLARVAAAEAAVTGGTVGAIENPGWALCAKRSRKGRKTNAFQWVSCGYS